MFFATGLAISALPFLVSSTPVPAAQEQLGVRIALEKRAGLLTNDLSADLDAMRHHVNAVATKVQSVLETYHRNMGTPHPMSHKAHFAPPYKRGSGADTLTAFKHSQMWYGNISVGTPPVQYTVDFDTGSADLVLPGPNCKESCDGHTLYLPANSSSSSETTTKFSVTYGDGSAVSGTQYTDTVSITGLAAENQTIGVADSYNTGFEIDRFPSDGLLGMAFSSLSSTHTTPLFQTLAAQNQVDEAVFAFNLGQNGSALRLGGTDPSAYTGDLAWSPVSDHGFWQISVDSIAVKGGAPAASSMSAIVDTGTTLILGDREGVAALYSTIPGARNIGDGTYAIPCATMPAVTLSLAGRVFDITPEIFNAGPLHEGSEECVGGVVASDSLPFWILGDVFLQNVYSVFDVGNNRVGFADLA